MADFPADHGRELGGRRLLRGGDGRFVGRDRRLAGRDRRFDGRARLPGARDQRRQGEDARAAGAASCVSESGRSRTPASAVGARPGAACDVRRVASLPPGGTNGQLEASSWRLVAWAWERWARQRPKSVATWPLVPPRGNRRIFKKGRRAEPDAGRRQYRALRRRAWPRGWPAAGPARSGSPGPSGSPWPGAARAARGARYPRRS